MPGSEIFPSWSGEGHQLQVELNGCRKNKTCTRIRAKEGRKKTKEGVRERRRRSDRCGFLLGFSSQLLAFPTAYRPAWSWEPLRMVVGDTPQRKGEEKRKHTLLLSLRGAGEWCS